MVIPLMKKWMKHFPLYSNKNFVNLRTKILHVLNKNSTKFFIPVLLITRNKKARRLHKKNKKRSYCELRADNFVYKYNAYKQVYIMKVE